MRDERKKAQWMNLQRNSSFINRMRFRLVCEKSGAIYTPSASGSYGRQAGKQSDEILVDLKFSNISTDCIVRFFMKFNEGTVFYSGTNRF